MEGPLQQSELLEGLELSAGLKDEPRGQMFNSLVIIVHCAEIVILSSAVALKKKNIHC